MWEQLLADWNELRWRLGQLFTQPSRKEAIHLELVTRHKDYMHGYQDGWTNCIEAAQEMRHDLSAASAADKAGRCGEPEAKHEPMAPAGSGLSHAAPLLRYVGSLSEQLENEQFLEAAEEEPE